MTHLAFPVLSEVAGETVYESLAANGTLTIPVTTEQERGPERVGWGWKGAGSAGIPRRELRPVADPLFMVHRGLVANTDT